MTDNDNGRALKIAMIGDRRWRIYYGDQVGGRYVNVDYDEIRDYLTGKRPRSELVDIYFGDDDDH